MFPEHKLCQHRCIISPAPSRRAEGGCDGAGIPEGGVDSWRGLPDCPNPFPCSAPSMHFSRLCLVPLGDLPEGPSSHLPGRASCSPHSNSQQPPDPAWLPTPRSLRDPSRNLSLRPGSQPRGPQGRTSLGRSVVWEVWWAGPGAQSPLCLNFSTCAVGRSITPPAWALRGPPAHKPEAGAQVWPGEQAGEQMQGQGLKARPGAGLPGGGGGSWCGQTLILARGWDPGWALGGGLSLRGQQRELGVTLGQSAGVGPCRHFQGKAGPRSAWAGSGYRMTPRRVTSPVLLTQGDCP